MAAITAGIRRILIGLGGSACTDGGLGAVEAITTVVAAAGAGKKLNGVELIACYDVSTAFLDAARVFAPQKGANTEQVNILSQRLVDLAHYYETDYRIDVNGLAGSGAAGGLGGGLAALGARLVPGFDVIANAVQLQERMAGASLVITGEGRLDATSFEGKVVGRIIRAAHDQDVPVAVIAGSVDHGLPGLKHSDVGWFSMEVPAKQPADRSAMIPAQMSANQICQASLQVVSLVERYGSTRALGDTLGCVKDATENILTGHTR
jgi:glycerate kinase